MAWFNLLRYVRRYQLLVAGLLLLLALFAFAAPRAPRGLNYRYQVDPSIVSYPLVAQTSGLVQWSTERVREVYRWNLTAETVAQALPTKKEHTEAALLPATIFIFVGAGAMILIWFVPVRRWLGIGLVVFVLAGSHLGAHPDAYTRFMAVPSTLVPNAAVTLVTQAEPGHTFGVERQARFGLKDLADRYFQHYVQFTEHRMASAGKLFATPKRLWFGVSGLAYVLPFAVVLAVLAAFTTLIQTLAWALAMLAPFGVALAIADGRAGLRVWQHVIMPLVAALVLLAVLGVVLPMVLFVATAVHAVENEIGLIVIGSLFPALLVLGAVWLARRRGRGEDHGVPTGVPHPDLGPDRTQVLVGSRRWVHVLRPGRGRSR